MKSFSYKRVLSPFLFALAVGSMLHCGGGNDDEDFTSQGDAQVMSSLVGIWRGTSAAGKPYVLTLCEDLDVNAQTSSLADTCGTKHQIQGGGRGKTETVSMSSGCGGCNFDNSAYMIGTLEGSDLASTAIRAQFIMDGDAAGAPLPYGFILADSAYAANANLRQRISMRGDETTAGYIDVSVFSYEALPAEIPPPPYDAGNGVDASSNDDAGDLDSGNADASESDADADDASVLDSGATAPAPTASSSASSGIPAPLEQVTTIQLARDADAVCPSP